MLCAQRHAEAISALILYGFPYDIEALPEARPDPEVPQQVVNTEKDAAEDFITPNSISQAGIQAYVRAALAADPVAVDWRRLHEFKSLNPARVHVPLLVLDGVHDPYARRAGHEKLFSRIAASHRWWVMLPNADHAAHIEESQPAFVRVVVSFLELLTAAQPGAQAERSTAALRLLLPARLALR
jgi:pimeloyl-ACP methyl ester carboxylesterase